jgi:hypothetical protein
VLAKARTERVERRTSKSGDLKIPLQQIARTSIQAIDVIEQFWGMV